MKQELETNVVKPSLEVVINNDTYVILSSEDEVFLDKVVEDVRNYIKENPSESFHNLTDKERDAAFESMAETVKEGKLRLRDVKFNFCLDRNQFNFLTDLLLTKMEYTVDTVFTAMELRDMLVDMSDAKFKNDKEIKVFEVTATEMIYMYHLISPYKVKGLGKSAFAFASVLQRIADVSKVINYYDTNFKNLTDEVLIWQSTMGFDNIEVVQPVEQPEVQVTQEEGAE
jgi:uncharacterized protein YihD (DUF1040 family)